MGLTQKRLKEVLCYEPETGNFYWLIKHKNAKLGDLAGGLRAKTYWHITIDGFCYKAHRLAWLYIYGKFPSGVIDHINRDMNDNRIINLRDVSHSSNCANTPKRQQNKSGFKGVMLEKGRNKFKAQLTHFGKVYNLGRYDSAEQAAAAYNAKAVEIFWESSFLNKGV